MGKFLFKTCEGCMKYCKEHVCNFYCGLDGVQAGLAKTISVHCI
jgi:hypothetical protein